MLKQMKEVQVVVVLVLVLIMIGVATYTALAAEANIQQNTSIRGLLQIRVVRQTDGGTTWVEVDMAFYVVAGYLCIREVLRWKDKKKKMKQKRKKSTHDRSIPL